MPAIQPRKAWRHLAPAVRLPCELDGMSIKRAEEISNS